MATLKYSRQRASIKEYLDHTTAVSYTHLDVYKRQTTLYDDCRHLSPPKQVICIIGLFLPRILTVRAKKRLLHQLCRCMPFC